MGSAMNIQTETTHSFCFATFQFQQQKHLIEMLAEHCACKFPCEKVVEKQLDKTVGELEGENAISLFSAP